MGIDASILTFILVGAFVLGVIDGLQSAADKEADLRELARPSIKHLEVEAKRAADELRALDREGGL